MKIFTNNTLVGHWPVGSAAVVVATDNEAAARLLEEELTKAGLSQRIDSKSMDEIDPTFTGVVILLDGDY